MSFPGFSQVTERVEYRYMSDLLAGFRKYIEKDAGEPIQRMEVNAALLLNDLCDFLVLGDKQRRTVLGKSAAAFVQDELDSRVSARIH